MVQGNWILLQNQNKAGKGIAVFGCIRGISLPQLTAYN
jgi:hypothetical protein